MPVLTTRDAREGRATPVATFSSLSTLAGRGCFFVLILLGGMGRAGVAVAGDGGADQALLADGAATDGGGGGSGRDGTGPDKVAPGDANPRPIPALAGEMTVRSATAHQAPLPRAVDAERSRSRTFAEENSAPFSGPSAYQSVVSTRRAATAAPREDAAAAASVLIPADSPRARDDLGTVLLEVPGANVTRTGGLGAFAAVSLRGSNPDEVRIYIDGIPLNQAVGGAVDLSTLPLGDVERVEVYRGSTPMAFSQSALGGVVSISTRTPSQTHASARAGAGSFRTMSSDVSAGGTVAGGLRLYGGLHLLRAVGDFPDAPPNVSGGYQPSTRENTDLSQLDGIVRAVLPIGARREVRAGFIGVTRDQGLPAQNIFRSDARAATTRVLAHVDYESRADLGGSSRLRTAVFTSATADDFIDRLHQIVGVPTATHDRTRTIGATVAAEKALGDWTRLSGLLAASGEDYLPRNDLDATMPAGYPARRSSGAAGMEVDVHSASLRLDVIPSARLEASRDVRTGRDPQFGSNLPPSAPADRVLPVLRLGLLRALGAGAWLRGNVGRYARIPSFVELYGYNRGVIGSPDLRPERGINTDLGMSVNRAGPWGTLTSSATVFGAQVEDLIAWQTYGAQTRAENISRARIWGLETDLRWRGRRLALIAQATLTDARDRGDIASRTGRQIEHHPRYRGYGRAEWRQPLSQTAFSLCGYADGDGTAGNFATTGPYSAIPSRLLVGAGLALEHARTGLRLAASAFNIADSRVQDFPGYPLPGRSFYVALGWSSATVSPEN